LETDSLSNWLRICFGLSRKATVPKENYKWQTTCGFIWNEMVLQNHFRLKRPHEFKVYSFLSKRKEYSIQKKRYGYAFGSMNENLILSAFYFLKANYNKSIDV